MKKMMMMMMETFLNMTSVVGAMKKLVRLMTRRMKPHQKATVKILFLAELAMQASKIIK